MSVDLRVIGEIVKIFIYMVIPALGGITFFALAKFVKQVAPMRILVSGEQTYRAAFWAFVAFGLYLALRPVQVVAGPHPWPLILSCVREFLLISVFAPSLFVTIMTLCYGQETIGKGWIASVFSFGLISAVIYCVVNVYAVGGSEEIVKLGKLTCYDGLWAKSEGENTETLMRLLSLIHLFNPGLLIFGACFVGYYHSKNYPEDKKKLYDNMPRKIALLSSAFFVYSLVLILSSFIYARSKVPDQWGLYPVGSLITGIMEAISLAMPVRSDVQISEHEV